MPTHKKIMILAGEVSGDKLGAALMADLKKAQPKIQFVGVGGELMEKEGLVSLFPMEELAVMGFVEVLPALPRLIKRLKELVTFAETEKIDLLLTIDAQDFSARLAKKIKARLRVPCVHYVSPTVWAWRPGRVQKMAKYLDHVLALFPFEPKYYEGSKLACTFVGHPMAQEMAHWSKTVPTAPEGDFAYPLALLPGSRSGEIARHLPTMVETCQMLEGDKPVLVPVPHEQAAKQVGDILSCLKIDKTKFDVVTGEERYKALQNCRVALAASGTVNLELAFLGVPMVVMYRMAPLTYWLAKRLVSVPYISPVNWVAGKKVLVERIQEEAEVATLAADIRQLSNSEAWGIQSKALQNVREKLACPADKQAEDVVLEEL